MNSTHVLLTIYTRPSNRIIFIAAPHSLHQKLTWKHMNLLLYAFDCNFLHKSSWVEKKKRREKGNCIQKWMRDTNYMHPCGWETGKSHPFLDEALNVFIHLLFAPNSHNLGFGALCIFFAFSFEGFDVYANSLALPLSTAARRRRRRQIERK